MLPACCCALEDALQLASSPQTRSLPTELQTASLAAQLRGAAVQWASCALQCSNAQCSAAKQSKAKQSMAQCAPLHCRGATCSRPMLSGGSVRLPKRMPREGAGDMRLRFNNTPILGLASCPLPIFCPSKLFKTAPLNLERPSFRPLATKLAASEPGRRAFGATFGELKVQNSEWRVSPFESRPLGGSRL